MRTTHQHSTNAKQSKSKPSTFFSPATVQPKLTIGQPNDKYEQEADAMADKVMRMPQNGIQRACTGCEGEDEPAIQTKPLIQRTCTACEEDTLQTKPLMMNAKGGGGVATAALTSQLNSSKGGGSPLSASTNSLMSNAFGADFSNVRVHTGSTAIQMNQGLTARAFTHGSDVYFNKGEYSQNSSEGKRLLGHELTHVVQQGGGDIQRNITRRSRKAITSIRRPKLSFYQVDALAVNHFRNVATQTARAISTLYFDNSNDCPDNAIYGSIPFRSGQEIIEIISKAHRCTGHPVGEVHIFSHGFTDGHGIAATESHERRGWVTAELPLTDANRNSGARRATDIPSNVLANNAIFVLHGCQIGSGDNSFAEQLLRHLVGDLPRVRVYAHSLSGVCGRNNDWKLFNRRHQDGVRVRNNPYHRQLNLKSRSHNNATPGLQKNEKSLSSSIHQANRITQYKANFIQCDQIEEERMTSIAGSFSHTSNLDVIENQFSTALQNTLSFANTHVTVGWWGYKLWEEARSSAQNVNSIDDRPLYWTRLRMREKIRNFNSINKNLALTTSQIDQLVNDFHQSSRGMPTGEGRLGWIPNTKRILISGFDPFSLDTNIETTNPSGVVALALDGKIINNGSIRAQIQSVIFPVSFDYFNQGNVESFFRPYISGDTPVDMVMTISQNGDAFYDDNSNPEENFELEEYALDYRNPNHTDNENEFGGNANFLMPRTTSYQSTLPRNRMRRDVLGRGYLSGEHDGGDYLSNEIFYRTSSIRTSSSDVSRRNLPVGHLHIPKTIDRDGTNRKSEVINMVRRLIISALPEI